MTVIKFKKAQKKPPFFKDIESDGYHVFSLEKAKIPGFYPDVFPDYPGVHLKDLALDDIITIRVFFRAGTKKDFRVDGGYLDLQVEYVDVDNVMAVILTELPKSFPLNTGESLEIYQEEILYKTESTEH